MKMKIYILKCYFLVTNPILFPFTGQQPQIPDTSVSPHEIATATATTTATITATTTAAAITSTVTTSVIMLLGFCKYNFIW